MCNYIEFSAFLISVVIWAVFPLAPFIGLLLVCVYGFPPEFCIAFKTDIRLDKRHRYDQGAQIRGCQVARTTVLFFIMFVGGRWSSIWKMLHVTLQAPGEGLSWLIFRIFVNPRGFDRGVGCVFVLNFLDSSTHGRTGAGPDT